MEIELAAFNKKEIFFWESKLWMRKMAILDRVLGTESTHAIRDNFDYRWTYQRNKNKQYSQRYIDGLIGEKEGRKWLEDNSYEVHEYEGLKAHFESIDKNASFIVKTFQSLNRRRKQEYKEQDKLLIEKYKRSIVRQVGYTKQIFGDKYFQARHLFIEIHKLREDIRHNRKRRRGSSQPDFITKKGEELSFVEVKANTSHLSVEQRGCFQLAKIYGFNALTLKVNVESNVAKDIRLLDYIGRVGSIEKPQDLKINQYEAIIEAFNVLGGARTAFEIKEGVTNKYGQVWKDFTTPMSKMVHSHLCSNCPKKYRVLTRQCRGVYVVARTLPKEGNDR